MTISVYKFLGRPESCYGSFLSSQLQVSTRIQIDIAKKDHLLANIAVKSKGIDKS